MAKTPSTEAKTPIAAPWAPAQAETSPPEGMAPVAPSTEAEPEPETAVAKIAEEIREVIGEVVEMVTVTVPKAFKLRVDNFREFDIKAGVQEMELELAEHWYSKANGVQVYTPGK